MCQAREQAWLDESIASAINKEARALRFPVI